MIRIATALVTLLVASAPMPALADCDLAKGEKVYKKCKTCHQLGDDAENRVGPVLNGIVGAQIASVEGFKYSEAFLAKKEEGLVWTEDELDAYLEKPRKHTEGTKMSFAGLRKDADRANVICYLKEFQ